MHRMDAVDVLMPFCLLLHMLLCQIIQRQDGWSLSTRHGRRVGRYPLSHSGLLCRLLCADFLMLIKKINAQVKKLGGFGEASTLDLLDEPWAHSSSSEFS